MYPYIPVALCPSIPMQLHPYILPHAGRSAQYYSVQCTEYRVQSTVCSVQSTEYRVQSTEYRVPSTEYSRSCPALYPHIPACLHPLPSCPCSTISLHPVRIRVPASDASMRLWAHVSMPLHSYIRKYIPVPTHPGAPVSLCPSAATALSPSTIRQTCHTNYQPCLLHFLCF